MVCDNSPVDTFINRILLYDATSTGTDYGFGIKSNTLTYHSNQKHEFIYGSTTTTAGTTGMTLDQNNLTIAGGLSVSGSANITSNLTVGGVLSINGISNVKTEIEGKQDEITSSTDIVLNDLSVSGNLSVSSTANIGSDLTVGGNIINPSNPIIFDASGNNTTFMFRDIGIDDKIKMLLTVSNNAENGVLQELSESNYTIQNYGISGGFDGTVSRNSRLILSSRYDDVILRANNNETLTVTDAGISVNGTAIISSNLTVGERIVTPGVSTNNGFYGSQFGGRIYTANTQLDATYGYYSHPIIACVENDTAGAGKELFFKTFAKNDSAADDDTNKYGSSLHIGFNGQDLHPGNPESLCLYYVDNNTSNLSLTGSANISSDLTLGGNIIGNNSEINIFTHTAASDSPSWIAMERSDSGGLKMAGPFIQLRYGSTTTAGGTTGFTMASDGKVTIAKELSVGGNLSINGNINFTGSLYQNGSVVSFNTGSGSSLFSLNGADAYYTAGNVGIGTSSPSSALDVTGNLTVDGKIFLDNGNNLEASTANTAIKANKFRSVDSTEYMRFKIQDGSDNLTISDDGNVEITQGTVAVSGDTLLVVT